MRFEQIHFHLIPLAERTTASSDAIAELVETLFFDPPPQVPTGSIDRDGSSLP